MQRRKRLVCEGAAVVVASCATVAAAAWVLGQDASWDTLNYHFYNPYAWLHDRLQHDVQPAMRQTYFNPLLDLPFYALIQRLGPLPATLVWAAIQGLLVAFAYGVARLLLGDVRRDVALAGATCLAAAGALAPFHVAEIGRFKGDNTTGILVLAALFVALLALRAPSARAYRSWLALAGLCAGLAFGVKPTNGPYALALALALWVVPRSVGDKARGTLALGLGGVAGALLTGGFWWWTLWHELGSPLFPQFNHVFASQWIHPLPFVDPGSRGETWLAQLLYPAWYNEALTGWRIREQSFGDLRIPLVLGLVAAAALAAFARRWRAQRPASEESTSGVGAARVYVLAFCAAAYVGWLLVFSIARYLLVLEVLAPAAAYAAFGSLRLGTTRRLAWTAAATLAMVVTYHHVDESRSHFGATMFGVEQPAGIDLDEALVVMVGHEPMAYAIPSLPSSARFVRVTGNLFYPAHRAGLEHFDNRLGDAIRAALAENRRRYVLTTERELDLALEQALAFGIRLDLSEATPVPARLGPPLLLLPEERNAP